MTLTYAVDLRLPATVMGFKPTADVSLSAQLGDGGADEVLAIARIDGEVGDWLARILRQGVFVRRRRRSTSEPHEIFGDVLDVARRAVNEGIQGPIRESFDLIGRCMSELPVAYRLFGFAYTQEATVEWPITDEQALSRELSRFCRDVIGASNDEAHRQLPGLGLKMALAAVRLDAPLLLQQGLDLWLTEAVLADRLGKHEAYVAYVHDIPELARHLMQTVQSRLQDESLSIERRLAGAPLLRQVFRFQTRLLKMHVDSGDVPAFKDTWDAFVDWARQWAPEADVDDAQFELSVAQDDRQRRRAERVLDLARTVASAKAKLVATRDWNLLNLGAWILLRYRVGELGRAAWEQLLSYVVGAGHAAAFETEDYAEFLRLVPERPPQTLAGVQVLGDLLDEFAVRRIGLYRARWNKRIGEFIVALGQAPAGSGAEDCFATSEWTSSHEDAALDLAQSNLCDAARTGAQLSNQYAAELVSTGWRDVYLARLSWVARSETDWFLFALAAGAPAAQAEPFAQMEMELDELAQRAALAAMRSWERTWTKASSGSSGSDTGASLTPGVSLSSC